MAIECLRDYDEADEKARARGCGVEVAYRVAPSHPKAKADVVADRPDGTVDLRTYRLARSDKPGGVP